MLYIDSISDPTILHGGETAGFLSVVVTFASKGSGEALYVHEVLRDIQRKLNGFKFMVLMKGSEPLLQSTQDMVELLTQLTKDNIYTQVITSGQFQNRILTYFDFITCKPITSLGDCQINWDKVTSLIVTYPDIDPIEYKNVRVPRKYIEPSVTDPEAGIDVLIDLGFGWALNLNTNKV